MFISKRRTFRNMLLAASILAGPLAAMTPTAAMAQVTVGISVQIAPPVLPVYAQPPLPEEGYIWTPGYWSWNVAAGDYYWVPGTWVQPPVVGVLWTPPYWGWADGLFVFHDGYWGPHVGFYGGVNYGYGYGGRGFEGGRWEGNRFAYNSAANNFGSVHVANAYRQSVTVINNNHVSYVGGTGGLHAEPTTDERLAEHDQHVPATTEQARHFTAAAKTPALAVSHNNGRPAIAATPRPAQFKGPGVVRAAPASPGPAHAAVQRPAAHAVASGPAAKRPAHAAAQRPAAHAVAQARPAHEQPALEQPAAKEGEKKKEN